MQDMMTMQEAARFLGVSRTKVWTLVKEGVLSTTQNPLDRREKLLRVEAVQQLKERGDGPRPTRPWPRSIGMFDGPVHVHSDDVDDYLREHWRPD